MFSVACGPAFAFTMLGRHPSCAIGSRHRFIMGKCHCSFVILRISFDVSEEYNTLAGRTWGASMKKLQSKRCISLQCWPGSSLFRTTTREQLFKVSL